MIRDLLVAGLILGSSVLQAQLNITLAGRLDYQQLRNSNLSNIWGYTDELGNEYALIGVNGNGTAEPGGISVVDISDPSAPVEVFFFAGPSSIWREIKVWNDHAYVTTEAESGGITIVDLSPLPQSTDLPAILWNAPDWETSHSLFIDENGRLYLHGADRGNGGVIMYDLTQDPMEPVEVGEFDNWYCHDSYARGDTLYAAHITDGFFSMVDVSDPASPVLLGTQVTPNNFTHNVWLDDSGDHLFTTDERPSSFVGSYDVTDPTDILRLDQLQSNVGSGAIPHNTYWLNDYLVTSYYTYGVTIYDAARPDNLVLVGHYDTSPFEGDGFNGAWGVYPFFGSQRLIISDIEEGLFILDPVYVRACWLEGVVRNAQTSSPVASATVTIVGAQVQDVTTFDGVYASGTVQAGTYQVTVSAPGYVSATIEGVVLANGELTLLDVDLQPLVTFALLGQVVEAGTATGVPGGQVQFLGEDLSFSTVANSQGDYSIPAIFSGEYELTAGQWGWRTTCPGPVSLSSDLSPFLVELEPGYADDFALDLGWTVSGNATNGAWERGAPVGTTFNGQSSNPGADVTGDCGDQAYVTGNGGGGAGDDDLDGGFSELRSPLFDASMMVDPYVNYDRWFFNAGGNSTANDRLLISLSNGVATAIVETVLPSTPGMGTWRSSSIRIADHLTPTDQMRFIAWVTDDQPGHLVEAAMDRFEVVDIGTAGVDGPESTRMLQVWPNPSLGGVHVQFDAIGPVDIEVHNTFGALVSTSQVLVSGTAMLDLELPAGTYVIRIRDGHGVIRSQPVVVVH